MAMVRWIIPVGEKPSKYIVLDDDTLEFKKKWIERAFDEK